jgi:hypothetical protein
VYCGCTLSLRERVGSSSITLQLSESGRRREKSDRRTRVHDGGGYHRCNSSACLIGRTCVGSGMRHQGSPPCCMPVLRTHCSAVVADDDWDWAAVSCVKLSSCCNSALLPPMGERRIPRRIPTECVRYVCRQCWHGAVLSGTSQVRGILEAGEVTAQAGALHDLPVRTAALPFAETLHDLPATRSDALWLS